MRSDKSWSLSSVKKLYVIPKVTSAAPGSLRENEKENLEPLTDCRAYRNKNTL